MSLPAARAMQPRSTRSGFSTPSGSCWQHLARVVVTDRVLPDIRTPSVISCAPALHTWLRPGHV